MAQKALNLRPVASTSPTTMAKTRPSLSPASRNILFLFPFLFLQGGAFSSAFELLKAFGEALHFALQRRVVPLQPLHLLFHRLLLLLLLQLRPLL